MKLPEGWKEVELGDVLDYEQPTKYIVESTNYDDSFKTPVLTAGKSFLLGHTNEKDGIYQKLPVIIFDDFTTASQYVDFPFKVKSSAMKLLTPKIKDVNLKYIFLLMQTLKLNSSTHKRYYLSKYQHIKIPLPGIKTQDKIVSVLEKAETAKKLRKDTDELTKDYLKSVFFDMFGDSINNQKKLDLVKIFDIIADEKNALKAGPFGSSLKKEFYVKKGYKIYGQEQVIKDDFNYGDYYISEERYQKLKSCSIKPGDILISLVGTYGKISIVPQNIKPGIINPRLVKISLDQKKILPIFFKHLLESEAMKIKMQEASHGGTMGILSLGILKNLDYPLPPMSQQEKFGKIVSNVKKMKEHQKETKTQLDDLFNSLMQRAFKGELQ